MHLIMNQQNTLKNVLLHLKKDMDSSTVVFVGDFKDALSILNRSATLKLNT